MFALINAYGAQQPSLSFSQPHLHLRRHKSESKVSDLFLNSHNRGDQKAGGVVDDLCRCHHGETHEEPHQAAHAGDGVDNGGVLVHPDDLGEGGAEEAGDQRCILLGISHQQPFEFGKIKLLLV